MQEAANGCKVEVFEIGRDRLKVSFWPFAVQDVDQRPPGKQAHRDQLEPLAIGGKLGRLNDFLPDLTVEFGYQRGRLTGQHDTALVNDRHPSAEITDIRHDMSGKNNDDVFPDDAQQVV